MTKTKALKICGFVLLFLGALDLVYLLIDISDLPSLLEGQSKAVTVFAYVFIGLCVLIAMAKFWMCRQALYYAKGNGKGTSHILLAKIGITFCVIALVSDVFAIFNGTASFDEALSSIFSPIVMYSYYKAAKACL